MSKKSDENGFLSRRALVRRIGTAAGGIGFAPEVFAQQDPARPRQPIRPDAGPDNAPGSLSIKDLGAVCDGVADDFGALSAALARAKSSPAGLELVIPGPALIGDNIVIPPQIGLRFLPGGMLKPANRKTVTAQGQWLAGASQTIDLSLGGKVTFAGNSIQKDFVAEWWGLPYNRMTDAVPSLTAMIDALPDYVTLRFLSSGAPGAMSLTLASPWTIKARIGLQIIAGPPIEETPQLVIQDRAPFSGGMSTISFMNCGHCLLQGFWIKNSTASNAINIGGEGPPRISTNNRIAYNRMTNSAANPNWTGVQIARQGEPNNEFMEIIGNYIEGNGNPSAGKGTGIYAGGNSNNHGHLLERNTLTGLAFGIDAAWTGYRAYRSNFNSNQVDIRIGHLCYPTEIIDSDSELSRQFYVAGAEGGESSVIIQGSRLAGLGAAGVAWIELREYIGPTTIIGNDYQNYGHNNSRLYSFPWNGAGNPGIAVNLIGNNYGNMVRQGMPLANFLVRTGVSNTQGPRLPINLIGEALSSGFDETFEENPAPQVPTGRPAAITINALYNYIDAARGVMLQQINIPTGMNYGPATAPNRRLRVFIVSKGGATTIAAGGNITRAGILPANSVTAFFYDPASGWWW
jgi:hypothetical protein